MLSDLGMAEFPFIPNGPWCFFTGMVPRRRVSPRHTVMVIPPVRVLVGRAWGALHDRSVSAALATASMAPTITNAGIRTSRTAPGV